METNLEGKEKKKGRKQEKDSAKTSAKRQRRRTDDGRICGLSHGLECWNASARLQCGDAMVLKADNDMFPIGDTERLFSAKIILGLTLTTFRY